MRICLIGFEPLNSLGGMTWSQHRIAGLLSEAGYEVHVLRLTSFVSREEWLANKSSLRELDSFNTPAFEITPWLCPPKTTYADHEVTTALQCLDERFDYAMFHCLGLTQNSYLAAQAARHKPLILSGRGSDVNRGRFRLRHHACLTWMLQRADWLTFVSTTMRDRADLLVPCRDRATVILNSTDEKFFEDYSPIEFDRKDSVILGSAGSFTLKKGADILAQVLKKLRQQKQNVKLYWIGDSGSVDDVPGRFTASITELVRAGHIRISGKLPHKHVLSYLKVIDIFVLASLDEGCPNVLLEAMLAKRAIVATAVGAVTEIIRHYREGMLIPPYDIDAMTQAVTELVQKPELRETLGQAAYERVNTFCTTEKEKSAWLEVYDRALRRRTVSTA